MPFLKRTPLAGVLGLLLLAAAPALHASGDWLGTPAVSVDDLSSYTAVTGVITALNVNNKPPLVQFTTEAGEVLILLIPKTALISIGGKLVGVKRLRVKQRAKLRWTVKDNFRVVGTLDVLPEEKSKPGSKELRLPAIPRPNLTRPLAPPLQPQLAQPAAIPILREPAPVSSPPPPRPAIPSPPPTLNQDLRR